MKKWFSMVLSLLLLLGLVGCGVADEAHVSPSGNGVVSAETASASPDTEDLSLQIDADMFTDRDYNTDYDESESVLIQLNGSSATASSDSVQISGSTITITEEATYILSGSLDDGMILVDAPDTAKLQLVLNGVSIHSETSAPLYILEADKVVTVSYTHLDVYKRQPLPSYTLVGSLCCLPFSPLLLVLQYKT